MEQFKNNKNVLTKTDTHSNVQMLVNNIFYTFTTTERIKCKKSIELNLSLVIE